MFLRSRSCSCSGLCHFVPTYPWHALDCCVYKDTTVTLSVTLCGSWILKRVTCMWEAVLPDFQQRGQTPVVSTNQDLVSVSRCNVGKTAASEAVTVTANLFLKEEHRRLFSMEEMFRLLSQTTDGSSDHLSSVFWGSVPFSTQMVLSTNHLAHQVGAFQPWFSVFSTESSCDNVWICSTEGPGPPMFLKMSVSSQDAGKYFRFHWKPMQRASGPERGTGGSSNVPPLWRNRSDKP